MAWSDIDFNKIIPGMITRGPAEDSFSDYLNEFTTAVEERRYAQFGSLLGLTPFEVGEIRNEGTFKEKLQDLIEAYKTLWFQNDWYSEGVMTDALNPATYIITDATIETEVGAEAWAILMDSDTMSLQEIFKASIFQAFFTIYENTFIFQNAFYFPAVAIDAGVTLPRLVTGQTTQWLAPSNVTGVVGETFAQTYSTWNATFTGPTIVTQSGIKIETRTYGAAYSNSLDRWEIDTNDIMLDGNALVIKQTKLDDTVVQSRVVMTGFATDNGIFDKDDTGPTEFTAPFSIDYPSSVNLDKEFQWEPNETVFDANGTAFYFHHWGTRGADRPVFSDPKYENTGEDSINSQRLSIVMNFTGSDTSFHYIDLNLVGLDYYITP